MTTPTELQLKKTLIALEGLSNALTTLATHVIALLEQELAKDRRQAREG